MSEPRLPENLSEWPDDPYAILGVQFGTAPRDVRRAYTQLIRTFKPEQFPDHFRRIREAYESVLRHVEFFGTTSASSAAEVSPAPPEELPPPTPLDRRGPDLMEQLDEQWEMACKGQESDAYRGLRDLHEQHLARDEVYLRLYWLLSIAPEVDSLRTPCDWLLAGLRSNGVTGPLRELYRRELAEHPEEAVTAAGTELLKSLSETAKIVDLVEWRWLAATRLGRWELIVSDVEALRERVSRDDQEAWVRLLVSAVEHLAWVPSPTASQRMQQFSKEAYRQEHLQIRLGSEFDRLEHQQEIVTAWHRVGPEGPDVAVRQVLRNLVAFGWGRPAADARSYLDAFLYEVAQEPHTWFNILSRMRSHANILLNAVKSTLLTRSVYHDERFSAQPSAEVVAPEIADFLDLLGKSTYDDFRESLLAFCLEEAISPEAVAAFVQDRQDYWLTADEHLAQAITADLPLHCIWTAHRLFWA